MPRPEHPTFTDELGLKKTMPAAATQFEDAANTATANGPTVFLGLGPEPEKLQQWFGLNDAAVHYLESPALAEQIEDWQSRVPSTFKRLSPEEFTREMASSARVIRYLPAQRAFPSFFAPLTARLVLKNAPPPKARRTVWIPSAVDDLLCRELDLAFRELGYTVALIDHDALGKHPGTVLPRLLEQGAPDLFFSVNFKGLDHFGLGHAILREAGTRVAVWMVDNPFNMLPAVKAEYWKNVRLFVTDHTFIGPLMGQGARWVTHLPLATSPALFETGGELADHARDLDQRAVFVGRSRFPDRDRFFAGVRVPEKLRTEVEADGSDTRFDYHWWRERMDDIPLWPGNAVREIGAGAEWAGHRWKRRYLEQCGPVAVFGDDGWRDLDNPEADLRPPVDYYAHLPAVYRSSSVTLNITGMQLPAGLTQRHFDVWCAEGFLLTDANPGLDIFPKELVEPIRFTTPSELRNLIATYTEETDAKRELRAAWKQCVMDNHTYGHRMRALLASLGLE